jgi:hypothetical protein
VERDPAELGQHDGLVAVGAATDLDQVVGGSSGKGALDRLARPVPLAQRGAVEGVVVDPRDVGDDVLPAVVPDDRSCPVKRLRQPVDRPDELALALVAGQIRHAPALVERHPRDDRRVAHVAPDHLDPLAGEPLDCALAVDVRARHL